MTETKGSDIKISSMIIGTTVAKFELPIKLVDDINIAYDSDKSKMPDHNESLAGKIEEEKLVNDILTNDMKSIFLDCFKKYLNLIQKPLWICSLENAWINDMYAGEYNPLHIHSSPLTDMGLSSVFMLKRPDTYGIEASQKDKPTNGWLQFTGGDQAPLSSCQLVVDAKPGEFFVFPYSLLHGVYPFNGTKEVRRTMSYNCNLFKPNQVKQN